jgi:hypothetical protein
MNEVNVGPTPYDEACTQAGRNPQREREECRALRNQLRRILGPEPEGARIVMRYSYTGGGYYDLFCEYEDGNESAAKYALACESQCPAKWDLMAIVELTAGRMPIPGDGAWKNSYSF